MVSFVDFFDRKVTENFSDFVVITLVTDELETVTNTENEKPNEVNLNDGILEDDSFFVIDKEGDDPDKPIQIVENEKSKKNSENFKNGENSRPKRKSKRYWQSEMDSLENPTSTLNPKKKRRTFEEPFETDFIQNNNQE